MRDPEFSIVVPAYQAEDEIGLCLRALKAQTVSRSRYEIIVADDGSTDGTAAAAREADDAHRRAGREAVRAWAVRR